jgi:hypothetical protein
MMVETVNLHAVVANAAKMLQSAKQAYLFSPNSYTHDAFVKAGHLVDRVAAIQKESESDWGCPMPKELAPWE